MRRVGGAIVDHPLYIVLGVVIVAFTWWAIGTRSEKHYLTASFANAFNLVPGQDVSLDGLDAGKISKVTYDKETNRAIVKIGIKDKDAWPLHQGTKIISRWGTTIGSGTRRVDVVPGPQSAPTLADNATIPASDTQSATELDDVLNTFSKNRFKHIHTLSSNMQKSFVGHSAQLGETLHSSAAGVEGADDLLHDLGVDTNALSSLITNTGRTAGTIATRADAVRGLVSVAATTFDTFANNTNGMKATVSALPGTLTQARSTLARADSSIDNLSGLVTDLAPGAKRLQSLAKTGTPALAQLRATLPDAINTVTTATKSAPDINNLLTLGTPVVKNVPDVLNPLAPMVGCVRPYAPELGSATVNVVAWLNQYSLVNGPTTFDKATDSPSRYGGRTLSNGRTEDYSERAMPQAGAEVFHSYPAGITSKQFTNLTGKMYAYPRPPGLGLGQPWFQPQCGITPDALDPSKDPEDHQ